MNNSTRGRRRWVWWGLAIAALLLLSPVILWLVWSHRAENRLQAAHQALRDAGMYATRQEFLAALPAVADEDNAALPLQAAIGVMVDSETNAAINQLEREEEQTWPLTLAELRTDADEDSLGPLTRQSVTENKAFFHALEAINPLTRPAVTQVQADFGENWATFDMVNTVYTMPLSQLREAADRLSWRATLNAADGQWSDAAADVRRIIGVGDAVAADSHTLVQALVAVGIHSLSTTTAMELACQIPDDLPAEDRAAWHALISLLLQTSGEAAVRSGLAGEAIFMQDVIQHTLDGRMLMEPLANQNAAVLADAIRLIAPTLTTGRYDASNPAYKEAAIIADTIERHPRRYFMAAILLPALERSAIATYRGLADLRLAAVSIAVALYRQDHDGQFPPTLDDLVPAYLPAVPEDPFAPAGTPLQYDAQRKVVWSIKEDGRDDGGELGDPAREWSWPDRVIELSMDEAPVEVE